MYDFDNIILDKLRKIVKKVDVPVVSILYNSDNINEYYICANNREKKRNITGHAEINCLNKVFKKKYNRNLSKYILISSLIPCEICYFTLKECYIKKIYYYLDNTKSNTIFLNNLISKKIDIFKINNNKFEDEYKKILKNFFNKMR